MVLGKRRKRFVTLILPVKGILWVITLSNDKKQNVLKNPQ
jgi:hypothetical protein